MGKYYTIPSSSLDLPYSGILNSGTRQLIWSQGHYGYPDFPPLRNVGGDFKVVYNTTQLTSANVGTIQGGTVYGNHRYNGNVWARITDTLPAAAQLDGAAFGAEAFAKMKPDRPAMNLFTSIYELKDIPSLLEKRMLTNDLAKLGDYYLAQKFGWDPLLQDIRSFVLTHIEAQNRLAQFIRDEGKPIRRSIKLAASETYSTANYQTLNYQNPPLVTYFYADGGRTMTQVVDSDIIWATAQFRYFLPPGPRDVKWTNRMKARIFGFQPTPKQVYNIIPWSWLVDWFTGLGNVLDNTNVNVVDRIAAPYFYVMRHSERRIESSLTSTYFREGTLEHVPVTTQCTVRSGCKTRLRGDPFGFGIDEHSLTNTQVAILGALGLSRLR